MDAEIRSSVLRVAGATALYALVHSALASRSARRLFTRAFGQRASNGVYRVFYIAWSAVTLGGLWLYVRRLPDRTLYEIEGAPRAMLHAGQLAGLAHACWAASAVGLDGILGVRSLRSFLSGDADVPPEPAAQGPSPRAETDDADPPEMRVEGPFRLTRHPLNLSPLAVFWLHPRMTARLLAYNVVATAYLYLGSMHEEARLRAAYGEAYGRYQSSGCPFYFPRLFRSRPGWIGRSVVETLLHGVSTGMTKPQQFGKERPV